MVKGKVIFEDEEKIEIKYPCFELKDVVEYYFEICTPNNSITPLSLVALPNANISVSIFLSDSSQTFKVHREHGISDTSGDRVSGSLTEAITVIYAPGTHEFAIKFKPGVLYNYFAGEIPTLVDSHFPLQKYIKQEVIDQLKLKKTFDERVQFAEESISDCLKNFEADYKLKIVAKAIYYINNNREYKANVVSNQVGVSTATLNRYFREVLGVSPKQCFRALRFKVALKSYRSNLNYSYSAFMFVLFSLRFLLRPYFSLCGPRRVGLASNFPSRRTYPFSKMSGIYVSYPKICDSLICDSPALVESGVRGVKEYK